MKVKTIAHIYYSQYSFEETGRYFVMYAKLDDSECQTYVGEQEIEIEVPDNYDPRAQKIAALQARKQKVMADYQKTVTEINARISELQAIEHTA
jgi:predicted DNA binding CopG/RHH family protein